MLAQELGFKIYAVGGFVRDILLARPNLDIDLVVEGDGIRFARELAKVRQGRVKEHQKFKTAVVVFPDGQRIDVATARLEYYEYPTALPTVELSSIKLDLYRRDFTINALALNLTPGHFGQLMDFFGAQRDIKEKVIRVLHSLSFVEDPTRILRAVRFEQRFSFRIDGQTLKLIKNAVQLNLFAKLTGIRLAHELQIILGEENVLENLNRLQDLKLLAAIHPQLNQDAERLRVLMELHKVHTWYTLLYLEPPASTWKLYMNIAVREWKGDIVFLRKLIPGPADKSYGIEVARLAGVPQPVVARAREILASLEEKSQSGRGGAQVQSARQTMLPGVPAPPEPKAPEPVNPVLVELAKLDVNGLSPLAALTLLHEWKKIVSAT